MNIQQKFIAAGGGVDHYGFLGGEAVNQWDRIQKYLSAEWKTGNQLRLSSISGSLEKLSTSLLQAHRIRIFHDDLLKTARTNLGTGCQYSALSGDVACSDFESLLLQSRAALDRLTWFVGKRVKSAHGSYVSHEQT